VLCLSLAHPVFPLLLSCSSLICSSGTNREGRGGGRVAGSTFTFETITHLCQYSYIKITELVMHVWMRWQGEVTKPEQGENAGVEEEQEKNVAEDHHGPLKSGVSDEDVDDIWGSY